jgi:chaperonin GroES
MATKKKANVVKKKLSKKPVKKTAVKKAVKLKTKKVMKKAVTKAGKKVAKKTTKQANKKSIKSLKKTPAKLQTKKMAEVKATSKVAPQKKVITDYTKAITPLHDRLVVRVLNAERMTAGGLIIPDTALMATGYLRAEVLAIGTGTKSKKGYLKPLDVKVGDKVLFAEYAGTKVSYNSENLHIIHESDVMGILED